MPLSVTRVVNALLCSNELYCPLHQSGVAVAGATNAVNTRQSEAVTVSLFFLPPHPMLLTPSPLPTGILYPPRFAHVKRPRWRPIGLNDRHLRSHGKIGDCEQSTDHREVIIRPFMQNHRSTMQLTSPISCSQD